MQESDIRTRYVKVIEDVEEQPNAKAQKFYDMLASAHQYFKDLEVTLTKINMHESEESKIARFVSGLRRKIQNVVELYEYTSLENMVHLAIKVESQRKHLSNILKMMDFTTHLGRIKINLQSKIMMTLSS